MHKNAKKQIYCKLYMRCYPSHMEVETAKGLWRLAELRECEKYQNTMKERGGVPGGLRQRVTGPSANQFSELTRSK